METPGRRVEVSVDVDHIPSSLFVDFINMHASEDVAFGSLIDNSDNSQIFVEYRQQEFDVLKNLALERDVVQCLDDGQLVSILDALPLGVLEGYADHIFELYDSLHTRVGELNELVTEFIELLESKQDVATANQAQEKKDELKFEIEKTQLRADAAKSVLTDLILHLSKNQIGLNIDFLD